MSVQFSCSISYNYCQLQFRYKTFNAPNVATQVTIVIQVQLSHPFNRVDHSNVPFVQLVGTKALTACTQKCLCNYLTCSNTMSPALNARNTILHCTIRMRKIRHSKSSYIIMKPTMGGVLHYI